LIYRVVVNKINLGSFLNFFLFVSFAAGIAASRFISSPFCPLILIFVSLGSVYFFYKLGKIFISDIFILWLFFFLGSFSGFSHPASKIDYFTGRQTQVTLKVVSLPQAKGSRSDCFALIEEIDGFSLAQKVKISDCSKSLEYLSRYRIFGKLSKRTYYGKKFYYLRVTDESLSEELSLKVWETAIKKTSLYLLAVFRKNSSHQAYRFLSSVFLGRRELVSQEQEFFSRAGAAHLLAISGLHLGLTAAILFFVLGFLGINFRVRLAVSLGFLYLYTLLSGANPSTLRAAFMYSAFSFSFFFKRRMNPFNSLGLAGLVCLLIAPEMLFTVGFQLSFLAVFAILAGSQVLALNFSGNRLIVYSKQIFFCSLSVTILTNPLTAYYFNKFYILTVFYNIILVPFFTLILSLNFLLLVFSPLSFVAQSLGALLSFLIGSFMALIKVLGSLKFSYLDCHFSLWAVFFYYFILVLIYSFLRFAVGVDKNSRL